MGASTMLSFTYTGTDTGGHALCSMDPVRKVRYVESDLRFLW